MTTLFTGHVGNNCKSASASATGNGGKVNGRIGSGSSKHHICFTAVAVGRTDRGHDGANHNIAKAIAIDIASAADRDTAVVGAVFTDDGKAACIVFDGSQVDCGVACFSQHHVGCAGIGACDVRKISADQQIGFAIAIEVARTADRGAAFFAILPARNGKTCNAATHVGSGHSLQCRQGCRAINHIAFARFVQAGDILKVGAHNQISPTIAIHIASTADRKTTACACNRYADIERPRCAR